MSIIIVAHNIRSTYNVGSILRTADGFGVEKVIFTGYTPYPTQPSDTRLPHEREKITKQIHKTALGAESTVPNNYTASLEGVLKKLKDDKYKIIALEQSPQATMLPDFNPPQKIALLLGEEVHGIEQKYLELCDKIVEIPMKGKKESFNVSVATGIALYGILYNKESYHTPAAILQHFQC